MDPELILVTSVDVDPVDVANYDRYENSNLTYFNYELDYISAYGIKLYYPKYNGVGFRYVIYMDGTTPYYYAPPTQGVDGDLPNYYVSVDQDLKTYTYYDYDGNVMSNPTFADGVTPLPNPYTGDKPVSDNDSSSDDSDDIPSKPDDVPSDTEDSSSSYWWIILVIIFALVVATIIVLLYKRYKSDPK